MCEPKCPVCHHTEVRITHVEESGDIVYYECRDCGHEW
jgi:transcription elongation factor Elf1